MSPTSVSRSYKSARHANGSYWETDDVARDGA